MSYSPVDLVEVRAWDRTVGAVTRDPATGFFAFEYDRGWVRDGPHLAPFEMPNRAGVFVFPSLDPMTFHRLPAMLADALPDRFGNALVDAWMAEQGIARPAITPLDRLAYAADRALGALEFRPPAGAPTTGMTAIELADLVVAARSALAGNLHDAPTAALHDLISVGTSAGGARAKAVVAYDASTGDIRAAQDPLPDGFTHWIIKLDGVDTDPTRESGTFAVGGGYGRVEFAYHAMATAAGIETAPTHLLEEGGRAHFMTRRFDRAGGGKLHMQTLCGIAALDFNLAGAHSYAQFLDVVARLGLGEAGLVEAFRRVVFNVAAVNRDDHTKNLAFLMSPAGAWSLAPAYDVTHSYNPAGKWTSRHQMSVNGKRERISRGDLAALAERAGVPGYRALIREVVSAVAQWPDFAAAAGVAPDQSRRIHHDHQRVGLTG